MSELSYSIGGADLRVKRRCLNNRQAVVCTLNVDPINSVNLNSTSTKADIFSFFGLTMDDAIENKTFGIYQVHPLQEPMNPPLYLFFYNESDFTVGHYDSIFPADGKVPEFLKSDSEIVSNVGTEPAGTTVVTESNRIAKKRGRPKGSKNKNSSATSPKRSKDKNSSATSPVVNDISNDQSSTVDDVFEESNNR